MVVVMLKNVMRLGRKLGGSFCIHTGDSQSYPVKRDKFSTFSTVVTSLIVTFYNIKLYSLFYKYTHVLLWF